MVVLSIPTYEPSLTTVSLSARFIPAASPTLPPSPSLPQSTVASPNGSIQTRTILGIVLCLVGFIVVILAYCFISRLPCFRRPQGVLPTSTQPRSWTHNYDAPNRGSMFDDVQIYRNTRRDLHSDDRQNRPRPRLRSPIQHVDPMIVPAYPLTDLRTHPCDHHTLYLPPYGGPSPPSYLETLQHPPQHLRPPPIAVVAT